MSMRTIEQVDYFRLYFPLSTSSGQNFSGRVWHNHKSKQGIKLYALYEFKYYLDI